MTFPNTKRINTEQFIDRTAALLVVDGRTKHDSGQPLVQIDAIVKKDAGMRKQAAACFKMGLTGM